MKLTFIYLFIFLQCLELNSQTTKTKAALESHTLKLEHIFKALDNHPQLKMVQAYVAEKKASLNASKGIYDPYFSMENKQQYSDYYQITSGDALLKQQTDLWGAQFYGGYRLGLALNEEKNYPKYYDSQTLDWGEFRVGVEVPLLKNGSTDSDRSKIQTRHFLARAAEQSEQAIILKLKTTAAVAYYYWISTGLDLKIQQHLLAMSKKRQKMYRKQLQEGVISPAKQLENNRSLAKRQAKTIEQQGKFNQAALQLSWFLTTIPSEQNLLPSLEDVKKWYLKVEHPALDQVVSELIKCHPALKKIKEEIKAQKIQIKLAENQILPKLNIFAEMSHDIGDSKQNKSLKGLSIQGGLKISAPLLFTKVRGKKQVHIFKMRQLEQKKRALYNKIELQYRKSVNKLLQLNKQLIPTLERVNLALQLEELERKKLKLGASNLFLVNLREQETAKARSKSAQLLSKSLSQHLEMQLFKAMQCSKL